MDPSQSHVSVSVYQALATYDEHPRPYLPNLVQLTCELSASEQPNEMLSFCLTLLGPSLRVLRIEGRRDDLVSAPFILSYSLRLSTSIRHLVFTLGSSPETLMLFEKSMETLNQLCILSLTLVALPRAGLWQALSASTTLAKLTITTSLDARQSSTRGTPSPETPDLVTLPQLTYLSLRDVCPTVCVYILSGCSFPSLQCMHIDMHVMSPRGCTSIPDQGANFIQGVATACGGLSLRKLTLNSSPGISIDQLAPLYSFPGMMHLIANISSEPDDTIAGDIARSWPSLQVLRLIRDKVKSGQTPPITGVTPNGLANIMRACRHLRELALPLDMRNIGLSVQRPWSDITNERITTLEIGPSVNDSSIPASHVATFLTDLFPNLSAIQENGKIPTGQWLEVSRLLEAFRVTRAQERQRAKSKGVAHGLDHA